ncbi:MAG: RDD family protein [Planctomycetia bacterium]|nr:RDD family protein [Planctomycetia bacterium]
MAPQVEYETPENVRLSYKPAGLGTRFTAWFLDTIILHVGLFFFMIALVFVAASLDGILRDWFRDLDRYFKTEGKSDPQTVGLIIIGIAMLFWGFGSFVYFGFSELLLRGQTIGKKAAKIRVVKLEGFALDAVSIFVRNIFRVVDHFPLLWIVPLLSSRSQRFGDMASGTIVVSDEPQELSEIRTRLASLTTAEARYRFDHAKLGRLKPGDIDAVERILERWTTMSAAQRQQIGEGMVGALCRKMQVDEPPPEDRRVFLEDLLAAEFRRQDRQLR